MNIKYFTIIICSLYTYRRLLNYKKLLKYIFVDLAFSLLASCLLYYFKIVQMVIPVMVISSFVFITIMTETKLELSITTIILSFGISYAFFTVSVILTAVIFKLIGLAYSNDNVDINSLCISIIQLLLINLPFRLRRLKNGMPFLLKKGANNIGVLISVILLCCVIIFSSGKTTDLIYIIPIILILLCGVFTLFWWRAKTTKIYIGKLRADEISHLHETIWEKELRIKCLEKQNEALAKIIHRDNKLIPTMELAVRECLQSLNQEGIDVVQTKGKTLITQLETMFRERSEIINEYQSDNKKLVSTDVFTVDILMKYMFNRARECGIEFELAISGSVKYMVEHVIPASDLSTLLADLIENAVIATTNSPNKKIIVSIGIYENHYQIDVFDSGIPFEINTLIDLGRKKTTTHADSGGSGIGMTTTFDILKTYNASFIIEEFSGEYSIFTKKVSVLFDTLCRYMVISKRDKKIKAASQRDDLIILSQ